MMLATYMPICTTLTPQIKGNHRVTNYMFPSVPGQHRTGKMVYTASPPGQHHDVAREGAHASPPGQYHDIAQESGIPLVYYNQKTLIVYIVYLITFTCGKKFLIF